MLKEADVKKILEDNKEAMDYDDYDKVARQICSLANEPVELPKSYRQSDRSKIAELLWRKFSDEETADDVNSRPYYEMADEVLEILQQSQKEKV